MGCIGTCAHAYLFFAYFGSGWTNRDEIADFARIADGLRYVFAQANGGAHLHVRASFPYPEEG